MIRLADIQHFFRISRPVNVLITLLAFSLACFILSRPDLRFFGEMRFWAACLSLSLITATGYWINDVYDFKIDRVNKPRKTVVNAHLSRKKVLSAYFVLLLLGMTASWFLQSLPLFLLNGGTVLALFLYAAWLKRTSVFGNLMVAALTAAVVYYAALMLGHFKATLGWTCMFAFGITFLREITKDIEDIQGDLRFRLQTLPIRVGIQGAKRVLRICYLVFILSCWAPLFVERAVWGDWNWDYIAASVVLVQLPCIYLLQHLRFAEKKADFSRESLLLKLMVFPGMLTLLFLR